MTRVKTLDPATPNTKLTNSQEALALISETIHQVRTGKIDPHVANAVGYLANIAALRIPLNSGTSKRASQPSSAWDSKAATRYLN